MKPQNNCSGNELSTRNGTTISLYNSPQKSNNLKRLVESRNVIPYAASILHEDRTVHYKKGKQLGDGFYIIEISSTNSMLYISAVNVEFS